MSGIRTASEASGPLVSADEINWTYVVALQLWSANQDQTLVTSRLGSLSIRITGTAGVRYGLTVIFDDDTWIWIDRTANLDDAIRGIQRVSAEHDIPIRRLGDDEWLKAAGY